jgi:predicted glycogen debranching enzyme
MIRLKQRELRAVETNLNREWLETNGLGGYASSTVLGINTRKYHGLLIAAVEPPVKRALLAARIDEAIIVNGARLDISASEYKDLIHPEGYGYLEEFRLDPCPVFTYVVGGVKIEKSVFMLNGRNTTCITYRIAERLPNGPHKSEIMLEVRPLVAFRSHHDLIREVPDFDRSVRQEADGISMRGFAHMPELHITFGGGEFEHSGYWYHNFRYRREEEDGYLGNEDLYSPGKVLLRFGDSNSVWIAFSTEVDAVRNMDYQMREEFERRGRLAENTRVKGETGRDLLVAAGDFRVRRGQKGSSIIAGYPWFSDWGRDAMISLPGLSLVTGRFDEAASTIRTFVGSMKDGLIPNLFSDTEGEAQYNTMDATLWLFEAVRKYYDYTGDGDLVMEVLPALREAISRHAEGTMFGIAVDLDGLLAGGEDGTQLTWMDAKVGDKVVTARTGKPVEVNALWYNALRITERFCSEFGGLANEAEYADMAERAYESFNREFWNHALGCLYDVVGRDAKDSSIRPNQLFAISLTHPVLKWEYWARVVQVVEHELLTPYGLRTLSPNDAHYRGHYGGDLWTRDHAYHQGTVWPWLLGHFITAYVRTHGRSERVLDRCWQLLEPFKGHLSEAGIGSISEIFDGDPPHAPKGCFAQAWSVAELLRAMAEDLSPAGNSPTGTSAQGLRAAAGN